VIFGPDLIEEAEATVRRIQDNLKAVKSRQETYANKRCRCLQFEVGDHVYLRVSPMMGMKRFGVKEKLVPKKCLKTLVDVVLPKVTPLEADLSCPEHPIKILDQKDRVTRCKTIMFFNIQWNNHTEEEATWQIKDFLRSHHPDFVLP
jgi:hypothetical protein